MVGDLAGRTRELTAVERGIARHGGVALAGEAGVGKSAILHEVERRRRADGTVVSIAGSYAGRSIPFGAVAAWLPEDPPPTQALLVVHLLETMLAGDGDGDEPVILCVDDAHLLDDASLLVVSETIRVQDNPVVLTVRTGEEFPEALRHLIDSGAVHRIEVEPLDREAVASIAHDQLGDRLSEDALDPVVDATRGNALVLRELLVDAVDTGRLVLDGDQWVLRGQLAAGTRVTELIRARAQRLDPDERALLDKVAVAEPVPLALLGSPVEDLATLERRNLVSVTNDGGPVVVETSHPMVGEALRQSMTVAERMGVLQALCRATGEVEAFPPGAAVRAVAWYVETGDAVLPAAATGAAWESLLSLDLEAAERYATMAANDHWRAAFVLAEVARVRGDGETAVHWHDRAATLADDDAAIRKVAMAQAGVHAFQLTDPKAAIASLRRAAGAVAEPRNSVELLCEAAFHATLLGEFDEVVTTCREVLRRPDLDLMTIWTAAINLGYAQVILADVTDLEASLSRAREAVKVVRADHPAGSDLTAAMSVASAVLRGRLVEAVDLADRSVDALRTNGAHRGLAAAVASEALMIAGDARAFDYALQSVEQLRAFDPYNSLPYGSGFAALLAATSDEAELASSILAEVDEEAVDIRSRAVLGRAHAVLACANDPDEAARIANEAGVIALESSHIAMGATALVEALAYRPGAEVAAILHEVGGSSTSPFVRSIADYAGAVANGDVEDVIEAAGRLKAIGAHGVAASALVVAAGLDDDEARARRSLARADATALRAGVVVPPWSVPDVADALSAREIEIALLAAEDRSDQEIADELYLARRTVGNHLHRAYAKLDVSGRGELRDVFARPPGEDDDAHR
ncbi:LuxR C-terminal-related transcriptional regulator [Actinospongicola halichondriae]|uniref:LuxR C-terminal-related transcriptional regulator n=1 Tax=Actinospongicola halichondriae TaxID=3236844 RepID=UPI003D495238